MDNLLARKSWSPYVVGAAIGVLSWFTFASANKPLGITTAFENSAALAGKALIPKFEQTNEYFAAKAKEGKTLKIGWEWMLVMGVVVGAFLSAWLSGDRHREKVPALWRWRFGNSVAVRFVAAFVGGAIMMFGARIAGGCTSGHGISGALQLAVASWVFVLVAFGVGIVTAFVMYGREGRTHV